MQISGSNFIVTGASSGLGEAVTRHLHALGARVVMADINAERGQAIAKQLENTRFVTTDITSEISAQECIDTLTKNYGRLDGLINCAGIPGAERVLGREGPHSLNHFVRGIQVNLIGTFNMIRLAAVAMDKNEPLPTGERGVIVNSASIAAYEGQVGQACYAAAKGGIVSMTLPIARELARIGVRVVTIAPGIFKTPMMDVLPEEVQQSLGESVPFPSRLGEPAEYAALVQQIIENCMLNGETIRLDGALRLTAR